MNNVIVHSVQKETNRGKVCRGQRHRRGAAHAHDVLAAGGGRQRVGTATLEPRPTQGSEDRPAVPTSPGEKVQLSCNLRLPSLGREK